MMDQEQVTEITNGHAVEAPPPSGAATAASPVKAPRLPAENPERPRFFKVYTLSDEAQRFIRDRLEQHASVPQIRRELEQLLGVRITHGSLARFAAHYRKKLAKREQACETLRAGLQVLRERGVELSAEAQARLLEVFIQAANENKLAELGPYAAGKLALAFADSDRKERQLVLREDTERRRVAVLEGRLRVIRDKVEQAMSQKADQNTEPTISPADALRELFGLDDDNEEEQIHGLPAGDEGGAAPDNSAAADPCNTTGEVPTDEKDPDETENK